MNRARVMGGVGLALAVLAADQASKYWILNGIDLPDRGSIALLPFLNLTMVWNHGVTFGLFQADGPMGRALLAVIALAVVAALGAWLSRARRLLVALPIGAIAGGAVGNVIDRLRHGAVVDFIHAHAWGYSWYVFNVADAAIVCGVTVLMAESLFARPAALAAPPGPG